MELWNCPRKAAQCGMHSEGGYVELWNCPRKAAQCGMQSKGGYVGLKHSKSLSNI